MNLTINDCKLIMKAYDLGQVLHFKRLTKGYANVNYCVKTLDFG